MLSGCGVPPAHHAFEALLHGFPLPGVHGAGIDILVGFGLGAVLLGVRNQGAAMRGRVKGR